MQEKKQVIIGNITDKTKLKNPLAKLLVANFNFEIIKFIKESNVDSIHEIGCGEGHLSSLIRQNYFCKLKLSDLSKEIIENNPILKSENVVFEEKSIYDLNKENDSAEMIVCCEVLEHLEYPNQALKKLYELNTKFYLFSVPNEPIWRILNFLRAKYWSSLGNTPGHLQHWSKQSFLEILRNNNFIPQEVKSPLPWTIVLATK